MAVKRVPYVDGGGGGSGSGKRYTSILPENAREDEAGRGILVGPPDLGVLGLPADVEARLHNELYARGVHTAQDARRLRTDVIGALMASLRVDVEMIVQAYSKAEGEIT